jgi:hypothetical protein
MALETSAPKDNARVLYTASTYTGSIIVVAALRRVALLKPAQHHVWIEIVIAIN